MYSNVQRHAFRGRTVRVHRQSGTHAGSEHLHAPPLGPHGSPRPPVPDARRPLALRPGQLEALAGVNAQAASPRITVLYARVSSRGQRPDLERQMEALRAFALA